jgi:coproporphyrinogen III oxidase-like Fe-S oxidoreductase
MPNDSKKHKKRPRTSTKSKKQRPSTTKSNKNPKKSNKTQDLRQLQRQWYAKLKDEGFKDIEIFNFRRGNPNAGEPSDYLHGHSLAQYAKMEHWGQGYHYYSRLRNFLTHNPRWSGPRAVHSLVARLYTEGLAFSRIVKEVRAAGLKDNMNKWHVHHMVKEFEAKALAWNKKSHLGLDYQSDL